MTDAINGRASLRVIAGDLGDASAAQTPNVSVPLLVDSPRPSRPRGDDDPTRIVVVGGGIAGLAAAWSLVRDRGTKAAVTVLESATDVGGKLRVSQVEGIPVDEGAESMLAVRPEGLVLAKAVGLQSAIVHPATTQASVFARGRLRALPPGMISGIPTDLRALAVSGIISWPGLLRIPVDHWLPRTSIAHDVSVGDFVATRLGVEVMRTLVEPMLGGVYAGRAEDLSLEMTLPALFRLLKRDRCLLTAAREARSTGAGTSGARRGPVFAGIDGGLGRLPQALRSRLGKHGVEVQTGCVVTSIRRSGDGWQVLGAGTPPPSADQFRSDRFRLDADAVILAVPAPEAARLLRRANQQAAATLATIDYASVGIVTMMFAPDRLPATLTGSGFLVPASRGYSVKAATFSSRKWVWLAGRPATGSTRRSPKHLATVRASLGRFGDDLVLQRDDAELAALAAAELSQLAGLPTRPLATRVTRWPDSLPQYTVGHRRRVARVRELLIDTPGIAVCGAAYDGVGVPACIGSAQFAAGQLATYLREKEKWAYG